MARLEHPLTIKLPPLPDDFMVMAKELEFLPHIPNEQVRALPANLRIQLTSILRQVHIPSRRDIGVAYEIDSLIRVGLEARPVTAQHYREGPNRIAALQATADHDAASLIQTPSAALIARSGEGKTRAIKRALNRYPKVILHDATSNPLLPPKQVVALHIECPSDRTIASFVDRFIKQLETVLGEKLPARLGRGNRSKLITNMAALCETYWVGLIVLDECQHALQARRKPDRRLLNFLVEISNMLRVPILFVGTPLAFDLIGDQLRQARRMLGIDWAPLKQGDPFWKRFVDTIWQYQVTRIFTPLSEELRTTMFEYSQGIPAIGIFLYEHAQKYAISGRGTEEITCEHLANVYHDLCKPIHAMVDALRSGDAAQIKHFEDLAHEDDPSQWFNKLGKLRESLDQHAAKKITATHKRLTKTAINSMKQDSQDFARAGTSFDSVIAVLMEATAKGIDPAAVLMDAIGKKAKNKE